MDKAVPTTSLFSVIANPEQFDGKNITVVGFFVNEFEYQALFAHRDDYTYMITRNGLRVVLSSANLRYPGAGHKKYVLMAGVFRKDKPLPQNVHGGTFYVTSCFFDWEQRVLNLRNS